jgi:predicted hotdog family 3-hydroxylacyl-ACP dehydratase
MLIGHDELTSLIPHAGTMSLLNGVLSWDDKQIVCQAISHTSQENPLRCDQGLSALQGIEYGAQAMAVHGGLLAREQNKKTVPGFLAALRQINIHVEWLDKIKEPLLVKATQLLSDGGHYMYEFSLSANDQLLLAGRATVMAQKTSI